MRPEPTPCPSCGRPMGWFRVDRARGEERSSGDELVCVNDDCERWMVVD